MKLDWTLTDFDREIWAEELEDFVPQKVFDAHAHLWDDSAAGTHDNPQYGMRLDVGHEVIRDWNARCFPNRKLGFLLLPTPLPGADVEMHNEFMGAEIAKSDLKLGSALVTPALTPEKLAESVKKYHFVGLKPYRLFAEDPDLCRITDYLTEPQIEVANEFSLAVTLHLSRPEAIADPDNLNDLRYLSGRYPKVRWVLAHCARAFNSYLMEKAIFQLRDIPNIWYDTSAVCDLRSHYLLFKHENFDRLMFGSDNVAAGGDHGKYTSYGHGWTFYGQEPASRMCNTGTTMVVYEQLRAQKHAAEMAGLNEADIRKLFWGNAARFFGFAE